VRRGNGFIRKMVVAVALSIAAKLLFDAAT
jgi:hypothetical protein